MGLTARTAVLLVVAAIVACALPGGPSQPATIRPAVVVLPIGTARGGADPLLVFAEVVATPESRKQGLSGRDSLPADGGMLFAYPRVEPRVF